MTTVLNLPDVDLVVASSQQHPGQWTILALQIPTGEAFPYRRAGLDVHFRNEKDGVADILLRWPDPRRLRSHR